MNTSARIVDLVQELRRRSVVRAAAFYGAVAWAVLQFADMTFPRLGLPDWSISFILVLVAIGFPVTLMLAWIFERGERGLEVTRPLSADEKERLPKGRIFDVAVVSGLCLAIGWMYLDRLFLSEHTGQQPEQVEHHAVPEENPSEAVHVDTRPSIAVLPFDNLSADENNAYFAAGMHEDILTHLSMIADLKVISRTSVMKFAGETSSSMRDIAGELGVKHILEGSVRRSGDQVRITVQLIDAVDDAHLWSSNFDRNLENIFAVQTEVAEKIAETLEVELTDRTREQVSQHPTRNITAYETYLKARAQLRQRDAESIGNALALFREAIELDPEYAAAYAGAGATLGWLAEITGNFAESREEILENANKALSLDPLSAAAHSVLGFVYFWEGNQMQESIREQRMAVSLEPNNPEYLTRLGRIHFLNGEQDIAQQYFDQVLELDPLNAVAYANLGNMLITHDNEKARTYLDRAIELTPGASFPLAIRGTLEMSEGRYAEAYRFALKELETDPVSFTYFRLAAWLGSLQLHNLLDSHLAAMEASTEISPDNTFAYYARMLALETRYLEPEDQTESVLAQRRRLVEQWLADNPNDPNARFSESLQAWYESDLLARNERPQAARAKREEALAIIESALQPLRREDGSFPMTFVANFQVIHYFLALKSLDQLDEEARADLLRAIDELKKNLSLNATRLQLAACYGLLDDREQALYWLEEAYEHGEHQLWIINRYGALNQFRDDLRFKRVIADIRERNAREARKILEVADAAGI